METELARESAEAQHQDGQGRNSGYRVPRPDAPAKARRGAQGSEGAEYGWTRLAGLRDAGIIKEKEYAALSDGLYFLKKMENLLRLLHDRSINELYESDFDKLSAELDADSDGKQLRKKYIAVTNTIRKYTTGISHERDAL